MALTGKLWVMSEVHPAMNIANIISALDKGVRDTFILANSVKKHKTSMARISVHDFERDG